MEFAPDECHDPAISVYLLFMPDIERYFDSKISHIDCNDSM